MVFLDLLPRPTLLFLWPEEFALFCEHEQGCCLGKGVFLFLQFPFQASILANQFLVLALQLLLIAHARSFVAVGIFCHLAPTGKLFGKQTPLTGGQHLQAFLLPAMAPALEGLSVDPCGTGDLSPQFGVGGRLHQSWLGTLVVRSDGADNFAGRGVA